MLVRAAIGLVAMSFLSVGGCAPALAASCAPTVDAVKMAQSYGLKPTILRGKEMAPFVHLANEIGSTGLEHAKFVAVIKTENGAAVFFGNVANVCGPFMIDGAQYNDLMRPS